MARGLSKTERVQLIDGVGHAGTPKGAMDLGGGIDTGLRLCDGSAGLSALQTRPATLSAMPARHVG